jgi:UDP-N-acetylglucosamine--N-acetylmuramyl-(pentapeptide) pyrophosphoryl-undecaprenol N-acetylglucosamine transferase
VDISGLNRSSLLKASASLVKFPVVYFKLGALLKVSGPNSSRYWWLCVFSSGIGSYLFPGCKTFIHEQNAYPGIANRKLAKKVDCVMINFPEAAAILRLPI